VHALNHQRAKKRKKFEESKRNKEERRNFAQNPSPLRERKKKQRRIKANFETGTQYDTEPIQVQRRR